MSIYAFKPTFLYIKQHSVTGKLYFGKTTKDPERYLGSGSYWKNHIKKYGEEHVVNLWYCLFYDRDECSSFALEFSKSHNIVESKDWANMIEETAIDHNGSPGRITSCETKKKISIANSGKTFSNETNKLKGKPGKSNPMYGMHRFGKSAPNYRNVHSLSSRKKISDKAKLRPKLECPYCGFVCNQINANKHHFDNCVQNPDLDMQKYLERKMQGRVTRIFDRKEMDCGNWTKYIRSISASQ